jgi:hypothetical protein
MMQMAPKEMISMVTAKANAASTNISMRVRWHHWLKHF